jgi:hypothetical protein
MVAPTRFGIKLTSSGSVPSAFCEMFNWGAVDRILWMGVLCLVTWCVAISDHHAPRHLFLLGILMFKGLTARRLYKSFRVKGVILTGKRRITPGGALHCLSPHVVLQSLRLFCRSFCHQEAAIWTLKIWNVLKNLSWINKNNSDSSV